MNDRYKSNEELWKDDRKMLRNNINTQLKYMLWKQKQMPFINLYNHAWGNSGKMKSEEGVHMTLQSIKKTLYGFFGLISKTYVL